MHYAVLSAGTVDTGVMSALLLGGADPIARDKRGSTPFHVAAELCGSAVIKAFLSAGADPMGRSGWRQLTPLHTASWRNQDISVIETLLEAGADPQARSEGGLTPLHRARTEEAVKTLVEAGADPMVKDDEGKTPLYHEVILAGAVNTGVIAALVRAGASPMAVDQHGWTLLHIAAGCRDSKVVEALVNHGASVGARNHLGDTPLDRAVQHANISAIEALLDAGAAPNRKTMRHARSCRDLQGTPSLVRLTDTWREKPTVTALVGRVAGWIRRLGQR